MKRTLQAVFLAMFAIEALVVGQGTEVKRVLGEIRAALGGEDKVAAVKSLSADGRATRLLPDGSPVDQNFEMAFDLSAGPVKFMKKEVVATMGDTTISRRSGFNGDELIDLTDMPPGVGSSGAGNVRVMQFGGAAVRPMGQAAPEEIARQNKARLATARRDFAKIVIAMIGDTTAAYPVQFTYGGQVDAAGGKADILELKAADGFGGKLYVDARTHLPLMLSWMDKEPLRMTVGGNGGTVTTNANGGQVRTITSGTGAGAMTADDIARLQADMAARMKEAEANRKTVEYRMYYADYKPIDGVKLPTRIQRMIDGLPADELTLEKIKVNGKIDPGKFSTGK
ncbi:MAG TPA: hypothetical protein VFV78_06405 [Vicinamibacterales bacterium]|nr:hypothetical protein [Vicinamibacterales bacterium]